MIIKSIINSILKETISPIISFSDIEVIPTPNKPPAILTSSDTVAWMDPEYYKRDNSNITFGIGSFVNEIYDRNGNLPLYRQNTSSKQPEYIGNALNNKAALKFDNSDDGMIGVNIPELFSNYSIIAVYSPLNPNSSENNRFIQSDDYNWYVGTNNGKIAYRNANGFISNELVANSSQIYSTIITRSNIDQQFYVNGVERIDTVQSPFRPAFINWGTEGTITNEPANGYLFEYIVIDKVLTQQERLEIQLYLDRKYLIPDLALTVNNIYWIDPAIYSNISFSTGNNIQTIADRSINGFIASQTISVDQPTYITKESATNYKDMPVIRYDGISNFLETTHNSKLDLNNYTIFIITKSIDDSSQAMGVLTKGDQDHENYDIVIEGSTIKSDNEYEDLTTGTIRKDNAIDDNITTLFAVRLIDSTSRELFKNGQLIANDNDNLGKKIKTNINNLILGKDDITSRYLDGDIADIIIFNKALSDIEMDQINKMLIKKHALIPAILYNQSVFWLDANKHLPIESVIRDTFNKVESWIDRNNNGNEASQTDSLFAQPIYFDDYLGINGAIVFDGIDDFMLANDLAQLIEYPFTVIFVAHKDYKNTSSDEMIMAWNDSSGANKEFFYYRQGGASSDKGYLRNYNQNIIAEDLQNRTELITIVFTGSNLITYRNGVEKTNFARSSYGSNLNGTFAIGMEYDGTSPSNFFKGAIGEIILFQQDISEDDTISQRIEIENYLRNKYKLFNSIYNHNQLVLWLDASKQLFFKEPFQTPISNNEAIAKWRDYNGRHDVDAFQNTSTSQPKYHENAINGLSVARFDGVNDFLTVSGSSVKDVANTRHTIFFVIKPTSNLSSTEAVMAWNDSSGGNKELIFIDSSTGYLNFYTSSANVIISENLRNTVSVICITVDGSTVKAYRDGVLKSTNTITPFGVAGLFSIGMEYDSVTPSNFYDGDLGELLIFGALLSDDERQIIENDLIKKWIG